MTPEHRCSRYLGCAGNIGIHELTAFPLAYGPLINHVIDRNRMGFVVFSGPEFNGRQCRDGPKVTAWNGGQPGLREHGVYFSWTLGLDVIKK